MHNSLVQKVLQSTDIVELVQEHVSLARQGKEYVGLCPFHPDHDPSLRVNPKKQIFKCFACGAGGDALKFVRLRERLAFPEALALLARRAGISLAETEEDRRSNQAQDLVRQTLNWARSHFERNLHRTSAGKVALDYALRRGLKAATIESHGLGFAPEAWDDLLRAAGPLGITPEALLQAGLVTTNENGRTYDRFRNRLIFPINDGLGRCVAFGGRALGDDPAKYLNSPETSVFSKSRILYGLDLARQSIEDHGEAIIVEGYMDAALVHQFGFTHAVATMGTALTDAHVKLLKRRADRLVLCFDGDQAGVKAADRAVEVALLGGVDVRIVVLERGLDPADYVLTRGADGFQAALLAAVDALEFKWSLTVQTSGDGTPRSRRAAIETLIAFVGCVMASGGINPLEQGLVIRRLGELLALPVDAVHPMLVAAAKRARPRSSPESVIGAGQSSYDESLRGLPVGLVASVEGLLGLLLADASCMHYVDNRFVQALATVPAWDRLYSIIQNLIEEHGDYARTDVIERCDDADVCDLVSRACARAAGVHATAEAFAATHARLISELDTQQLGDLQRSLSEPKVPDRNRDEDLCRLLETARTQDFALAAQTRLNAASQGA